MLFWGVTYITCCYTLTLPLSEDLHLLFCVLHSVVLENHSDKFPLGGSLYPAQGGWGGWVGGSAGKIFANMLLHS